MAETDIKALWDDWEARMCELLNIPPAELPPPPPYNSCEALYRLLPCVTAALAEATSAAGTSENLGSESTNYSDRIKTLQELHDWIIDCPSRTQKKVRIGATSPSPCAPRCSSNECCD